MDSVDNVKSGKESNGKLMPLNLLLIDSGPVAKAFGVIALLAVAELNADEDVNGEAGAAFDAGETGTDASLPT